MACIVMLIIILLSLVLGAELGPKADPTTTTYAPAARVVLLLPLRAAARHQAAGADAAGDDRHPDDLHDPAVPAAVLRPRAGAAPRAPADRDDGGHLHDRRDGLPDLPRRRGRLAERDRASKVARRSTSTASRSWPSRAAWPATRSARTATTAPARHLTDIADKLPKAAIARTLVNPTAPMPSYAGLPENEEGRAGDFLAQLHGKPSSSRPCVRPAAPRGRSRSRRSGRCSTASPASMTS